MDFKRPANLEGSTTKILTAHGNLYVTVNLQEGRPIELFAALGKAGSCDFAYMESMTRLVSIGLQWSVPVKEIIRQLKSITCHPFMVGSPEETTSPADAIARVLERYTKEGEPDAS